MLNNILNKHFRLFALVILPGEINVEDMTAGVLFLALIRITQMDIGRRSLSPRLLLRRNTIANWLRGRQTDRSV